MVIKNVVSYIAAVQCEFSGVAVLISTFLVEAIAYLLPG
jgi:hypothetical protein